MTRTDWQINIENLVASVTEKVGAEAAAWPFLKFGATCFDDLSPAYYDEVLGDLMLMDADP